MNKIKYYKKKNSFKHKKKKIKKNIMNQITSNNNLNMDLLGLDT